LSNIAQSWISVNGIVFEGDFCLSDQHGESCRELTRAFGKPTYGRLEARATPEQKERLTRFPSHEVKIAELAGEKIRPPSPASRATAHPSAG
jgi:phosphoglucomutase